MNPMAMLPQSAEELLEVVKTPLGLLERIGIDFDLQGAASDIADRIPSDTGGVFPWLEELWAKAEAIITGGDILGGLWELVKELLSVAVGLFGALVDLLRSLIGSF